MGGTSARRKAQKSQIRTAILDLSSLGNEIASSSNVLRRRKVKKQEIMVLEFQSWSKHPNRWELYYWLGWLGFKPSKIEIERGSGSHEYS